MIRTMSDKNNCFLPLNTQKSKNNKFTNTRIGIPKLKNATKGTVSKEIYGTKQASNNDVATSTLLPKKTFLKNETISTIRLLYLL